MADTFAFFDLDHTLLPFDTQTLFCNYVLRQRRWRMLGHFAFAPVALARALKVASTASAKRAFLSYLAGLKKEELLALAKSFAESVVKLWVYPELSAIVQEHRDKGRILILNTASPDFYAAEIARVLGFDYCVATRFEVPDRLPLLPKLLGPNNKREAKIAAMREKVPPFAAATPEALLDSWSYSDSSADLPLLELAGHAVLVHPSARLAALGQARGWTILKPKRPYASKAGDMFTALVQMLGLYSRSPA